MNYLILGSDPYKTSTFSKITRHVIKLLSKDKNNKVFCLCNEFFNMRVYENVVISGFTSNPEQQLSFALSYFKPDACILIGNIEDYLYLNNYYKNNSKRCPIVGILNVITMPILPSFLNIFENILDEVIVYSRGIFNLLIDVGLKNVTYNHLGINRDTFYPISNQQEIYNKNLENEIFSIVSPGSNSHNNYKQCLIESFAHFSKNKNEVYLYFSDRDDRNYFDIEKQARKYPWLKEKILIDNKTKLFKTNLNNIYNSSNICIDCSINSCYNLSILESIYCGCYGVITNNPFNPIDNYPNIEGCISQIESVNYIQSDGNHFFIPDFKHLIDIMEKYYKRYKENELIKLNITDELEHYFSWWEFNTSLEYILSVSMNNNVKIENILL